MFPDLEDDERLLAVRSLKVQCCPPPVSEYAQLVKATLEDNYVPGVVCAHCWKYSDDMDIELTQIDTRECTAFKVSTSHGSTAVALKMCPAGANLERLVGFSRMAPAELAPRMLAHGHQADGTEWIITEWLPGSAPLAGNKNILDLEYQVKAIGVLLARIHSVGTEWNNEDRQRLLQRRPELKAVAAGSHAWVYATHSVDFTPHSSAKLELRDDSFLKLESVFEAWAGCGEWAPQHPVGRRIVSSHADFRLNNLLEMQGTHVSGMKAIDFDFLCVTHAIHDIGFMLSELEAHGVPEFKRAFLKAYL